jgi:hypothetical protein
MKKLLMYISAIVVICAMVLVLLEYLPVKPFHPLQTETPIIEQDIKKTTECIAIIKGECLTEREKCSISCNNAPPTEVENCRSACNKQQQKCLINAGC